MEQISHDVVDKCVEFLNIENDDIQLAAIDLMISLLESILIYFSINSKKK